MAIHRGPAWPRLAMAHLALKQTLQHVSPSRRLSTWTPVRWYPKTCSHLNPWGQQGEAQHAQACRQRKGGDSVGVEGTHRCRRATPAPDPHVHARVWMPGALVAGAGVGVVAMSGLLKGHGLIAPGAWDRPCTPRQGMAPYPQPPRAPKALSQLTHWTEAASMDHPLHLVAQVAAGVVGC